MGYFGAYEFLVYVVPGGLLLFFICALFPAIRNLFGKEPVNVGGLVLFLVVSFVLGQLLQSIATYTIQPVMVRSGLAYRTSTVLFKDQNLISPKSRSRLENWLPKDFGFAKEDLAHASGDTINDQLKTEWRNLIRRLHTKINLDKLSDRLDVYAQNYALSMALAVSLVCIFLLVLAVHSRSPVQRERLNMTALPRWVASLLLILIPLAFLNTLERMSNFDRLFAEELFGSYLQSKPQGT